MMGKHVLIVDDDEDMQHLLQEALEVDDYEVSVAQDGLVALEEIEKAAPDLILLDLMMPRMDGFAFAKALHQRDPQSSIPIIVLSADINVRQKVEQMGAKRYMTKPFDLSDLLQQVSSVMGHLATQELPPQAQA